MSVAVFIAFELSASAPPALIETDLRERAAKGLSGDEVSGIMAGVGDEPSARRDAAMRSNYERQDNLSARQSIFAFALATPGQPTLPDLLRLLPGQRVLDVGCGNGLWLDVVTKQSSPSIAVGVDLSLGMVQATAARCPEALLGRVDAVALPFRDATFDAALALWMLYHVPDKPRALSELRRVIRDDGQLYAATNAPAFDSVFDDLVRRAIETTTGVMVARWLERLDFDAQNGSHILADHFDHVEQHLMHRDFVVPEAAPLIHYIASLQAPIEAEVGALDWPAFLDALQREIDNRLRSGPVSYRTTSCLFICS